MLRAVRRLLPLLALLAAALTACDPRAPGPLPEDEGKVTFWQIGEASLTFSMCTNDAALRESFTGADALVGTFLAYRVEEGGETATALECTTTEPSSCGPPTPPLVFAVNEHQLRSDGNPEEVPVVGFDCRQTVETDWLLVDEGDELALDITTRYALAGTATACEALDAVFVDLGTNGAGIKDCVGTLAGRADLFDVL